MYGMYVCVCMYVCVVCMYVWCVCVLCVAAAYIDTHQTFKTVTFWWLLRIKVKNNGQKSPCKVALFDFGHFCLDNFIIIIRNLFFSIWNQDS